MPRRESACRSGETAETHEQHNYRCYEKDGDADEENEHDKTAEVTNGVIARGKLEHNHRRKWQQAK